VVLRADWEDRGTLGEDLLGSDAASNVERTLRDGAPAVYVRRGASARADELCLLEGAEPLLGGADTRRAFAELCVDPDLLIRRGVPGGFGGPSLSLRIFDLSSPAGQHLIYGQTRAGDAPAESAWHEAALAQHDLRLGGRLWRVMVTRAALGLDRSEPLSVLVAGLVVATLLAGSTFALSAAAQLRRRLSRFERLGQYVLEEKLGSGGMGTVYRARHNLLRRPTAVKVIPASLQNDGALLRFEREVRITASLSHPNTVAVYDFGRIRGGGFYYAMEYLEGLDLQRLVECHGPQSEARVVHILVQAAGALAEAHERGVIHRDVKPANLMLCTRGGIPDFVKVLDFGLVKDLCHRDELERRDFVGTPLYASPEASLAPDAMDARSDLYALGAVAFFLLTGREVFRGPRVIDVLSQHVSTPVPSFSEVGTQGVSRALEALVRSCLAKTPAHRPPSATGLRRSLEGIARLRPWSDADARRWWAEHAGRSADSVRAEPVSREQIALQNTQVEVHRVMRRAPP
jgi:Protein kinase domain